MVRQHSDKGKCSGKERLINAAQVLAKERPFANITIDDISKTAELSRPAFYYHFAGGKEELRAELIHRGILDEGPVQDTQQAILEAALRVFARAGISAATLEDIAAEAGVTRGTLLWHFHSKDELLSAIIKRYGPHSVVRPVVESIEQHLRDDVPLDDEAIVRKLVAAFYDGFTEMGDYARLAILLVHTHPEAARLLAEKIVKGRKSIIEYVKKRQEDGSFCQDIDPAFFVQVISLTCAMRVVGQGLSDLLPLAHLSREEIIDQFVSLLLYGIVRRDQPPKDEAWKGV
ncbi:MAG TPA: TetR/AcrR family transcriptional regulator [Ktedonobacteraceae bacterium]|nr:TetR/AcrR family transcriptional regulator [Ktedonobacteraceae bacterium]